MNARTQVMLWAAQRVSAAVLALCVLVHLAVIIYAVRNGLTGGEILARTRGSAGWAAFYAVFVAAVSVHAPIGLRAVLLETLDWKGRSRDVVLLVVGIGLFAWGMRAVWAVVAG